ncbi:DUF6417 family protein [Streptomyces phaeochromogenes]|nr:DUF6417 family protein [Streptomyces phaeochromogenes]
MNGPEAFSLRAESRVGTHTAALPGAIAGEARFVRDRGGAGCVAQAMDDYDPLDRDAADLDPMEHIMERLALLTLEEAHDLLRLLQAVAREDGLLSPDADRWAQETAARIPSEN